MDFVVLLHSLVRFAILIMAVVGIVMAIVALATRRAPGQVDRTVGSIFLGLYDLQVLLGLLIILLGGLKNPIHPVIMFAGVVIAHFLQARTRGVEGSRAHTWRLAFYVVPLAVILVGLSVINHLPT